jgi:hypothetical protein
MINALRGPPRSGRSHDDQHARIGSNQFKGVSGGAESVSPIDRNTLWIDITRTIPAPSRMIAPL